MPARIPAAEEIENAERDIFEDGACFNKEQKDFLKCFESCYVQAYAGTGKTSSIVGRLHILAQQKTWRTGRGICVVSHTNVAVDEIKRRVARHYPEIMEYPNFVGTIQEFVNKFLFIPFLSTQGFQMKYQDEVIYLNFSDFKNVKERITKYRNSLRYNNPQLLEKFEQSLRSCFIYNNEICIQSTKEIKPLLKSFGFQTKACTKEEITVCLKELISRRKQSGQFLYSESFIDSLDYLEKNKVLENIIRQRFDFVFLDEAQDCSEIQLRILYKLFSAREETVFQQIGDENQSISESEGAWKSVNAKYLGLSERVRENLANFVNYFKVDSGAGMRGRSISEARLYLIIYNAGYESNVLEYYARLIKSEDIPGDKDFFAVSHKHQQLLTYFPNYSENIARSKNRKSYLRFENDDEYVDLLNLERVEKNGTQFIAFVLTSLIFKYYKQGGGSLIELKAFLRGDNRFGKLINQVAMDILKNRKINNRATLQDTLNDILGEEKISFNSESENSVHAEIDFKNTYISSEGVEVKLGTIHSVKGQTHNATLYFSNNEYSKQDIQHVLDNTGARTLFFKKLIYVASSRAKYLFAIAIERSAYEAISNKSYFNDFKKLEI